MKNPLWLFILIKTEFLVFKSIIDVYFLLLLFIYLFYNFNEEESDGQKTNIKYPYGNCSDRGDMKK